MVGRNRALRLDVFYDGWFSLMIIVISSMMYVIYFMLDGCIMYVMFSFTWLYLYHGFNVDDVSPFYIYILWTLDLSLFSLVEVVVVRLNLIKVNVTQCLGILKECNLLCMFTVDCMLLLPLLFVWCVWFIFLIVFFFKMFGKLSKTVG